MRRGVVLPSDIQNFLEVSMEFASKGVAGAGLGIAGTALGLLNGGANVLGGYGTNPANAPINRYEAEQSAKIAALETEVKLRDANAFTMGEMGKFRDYVETRLSGIETQLSDQKAYNAANNAAIGCISGQIAQLYSLTKLVVPNNSVCPGWGAVKITPETATTTTPAT